MQPMPIRKGVIPAAGLGTRFLPASEVEAVLEKAGRTELLDEVRRTETLADIFYVQQHRPLGLGHAVLCAADFVDDEPFAVLLPDELFDPKDNFLGDMVETFEARGLSVVAGLEVPHEEISRYGAMAVEDVE